MDSVPILGILLSIHLLEPIRIISEKSFRIRLLESPGTIQEFILNPEDRREVVCEGR